MKYLQRRKTFSELLILLEEEKNNLLLYLLECSVLMLYVCAWLWFSRTQSISYMHKWQKIKLQSSSLLSLNSSKRVVMSKSCTLLECNAPHSSFGHCTTNTLPMEYILKMKSLKNKWQPGEKIIIIKRELSKIGQLDCATPSVLQICIMRLLEQHWPIILSIAQLLFISSYHSEKNCATFTHRMLNVFLTVLSKLVLKYTRDFICWTLT